MFRRRRKEGNDDAELATVEEVVGTDADETDAGPVEDGGGVGAGVEEAADAPDGGPPRGPSPDAPDGPHDEADVVEDDLPRVDLGALRVPIVDGVELRLEVNEQGELGQVLLVEGANIMQVGVFAAPRSSGIWDEVRAEILGTVSTTGGTAEEVEGLYDIELMAQVPTGTPGQLAPARFIGIDRPRWFIRALISGPAASDRELAAPLLEVLAQTVVVRGKDAMPIRDPLPLRLPKEAVEAAEAQAREQEAAEADGLDQLGPGPTITETR